MKQEKFNHLMKVCALLRGVILLLCVAVAMAFASCASHKEQHQHQTHVVNADTLKQEAQADGHHHQTALNIDSLVTASIWNAMQEFQKTEQEHETITETLTETIDSLGRVIRQQQKVTDRTVSKQELQRQQEQLQSIEQRMVKAIHESDSMWQQRISTLETHLRDSIYSQIDKVSQVNAAPSLTWWQKLWQQWKGFLAGVLVAAVVFLTRKIWSKFIDKPK